MILKSNLLQNIPGVWVKLPRFFIDSENLRGGIIRLEGDDAVHIRALRLKAGDEVTLCDGNKTDFCCKIAEISRDSVTVEPLGKYPSRGEPSVDVSVYVAFAKGDKLSTVVQKSVELGAGRIVLFPSARCVSRPNESESGKKSGRLSKIAEEAAKQCGRGIIPPVFSSYTYDEAVSEAAGAEMPLYFYEDERMLSFKDALNSRTGFKTASIFVGPEGGFEPFEVALARERGMLIASLGSRILRCETAPVAALAALMYHTGNL